MKNRVRNTFVLLTIVFAFASQCVSAEANTNSVSSVASGVSAPTNLAPANPAPANLEPANPAPANLSTANALPPPENIEKIESATLTNNNVSGHIVDIEVYYEALCIDSVNFVSNQLLPTFNKLNKFINVTFIPFAKGNISFDTNQTLNFSCKREGECVADKVHACGIHKIKNSEQLIKFVNCSLTKGFYDSNKTVPIDLCGSESNIEKDVIEKITICSNNTESNTWLQDYRNKSSTAHVEFVPKVIINKNSTYDTTSTVPFINAVCKQIPDGLQPEDCKSLPSGSDALVIGVLPIIIGAFYFIKLI